MSAGKKRSRKSKLLIRNDVDFDETESTVLKKITFPLLLQSKLLPTVKYTDHTYSRKHDEPSPSPSPLQLSVKVEVEEFDESIITAEKEDTNEIIKFPPPQTYHASSLVGTRSSTSIRVFSINLDKMYKISDHITWSSNNPADKYLGIELRNIWGRILHQKHKEDPYDTLIQKALKAWSLRLINGRLGRESPIFYQCHICNCAWWFLHPFREHIKLHDIKKLKVYNLENQKESIIVASEVYTTAVRYIPCDGNCYRCGKNFSFHIRSADQQYSCSECHNVLRTCTMFIHHDPICQYKCMKNTQYPNTVQPNKNFKCTICYAEFITRHDWETHTSAIHIVRSDEPSVVSVKTCPICDMQYHHYYSHMCPKRLMNGACIHCYRKFANKTIAAFHGTYNNKKFTCKVCGKELMKKCMETEHMLTHTDKYKMAYKCVHPECPPTTLYPDDKSIKMHRLVHHKWKYEKRKTIGEMVLIPEQCAKLDLIQELDFTAACEELQSQEADIDAESTQQIQTVEPTVNCNTLKIVQIKEEPNEFETDNFAEDQQDDEMDDYEQLLSKVFKVSDVARGHRVDAAAAAEQESIVIKTEPVDDPIELEQLIEGKDNPRTLVEEHKAVGSRVEVDGSRVEVEGSRVEVDGSCVEVEGSCVEVEGFYELNEPLTLCNVKFEPHVENIKQEHQSSILYEEPLVTVVKIEPQELIEATDFQIIETSTPQQKQHSETNVRFEIKTQLEKFTISQYKKMKLLKRKYMEAQSKKENTGKNNEKKGNGVYKTKLYRCGKCGYTNIRKLYQIHVNSKCTYNEKLKRIYTCTKCDMSFANIRLYLIHFEMHGYESLSCPQCGMHFDNLKDMMPHFQKHVRQGFVNFYKINIKREVSTRKNRCKTCSEEVAPGIFFEHWERHLVLNETTVKVEPETTIEESDKISYNNTKLLQPNVLKMVLEQLKTGMRHRQCGVCLHKFSRLNDYKRHMIEHLLMDAYVRKDFNASKALKCQICFKEFLLMEKYKFHMREHGGLPVYKCELCDKTFSDSSNFAKHKKIHSLKVLICDICSKKFHAKSQLIKHLMMHQTTDPIKCEHCPAKFYTNSQYKKHMKTRHNHSTRFRCMLCDLYFDSLRKKWDHMWVTHKERKQLADCPICNQGFRKFFDVRAHAKSVHNTVLTYFNMKTDLRRKAITMKTPGSRKSVKQETLIIQQHENY